MATSEEIKTDGFDHHVIKQEPMLHMVIFWESDDTKIAMMIQLIHHAFVYGMILWYFYLHIFSDSYLQFVLFCFTVFLIWIQHLLCGVCLFFNVEQKLIGNHPNIMDNLLHIFHIPPREDISNRILFMMSSLIMVMLATELLYRTITVIKYWV